MDKAWSFEHSVTCPVTRELAWTFWTNVSNWGLDSDVESVELSGPFATGSRGATITRSSGRIEWLLAEVEPRGGAVIEFPLPGATGLFRWTFEDLDGGHTRITQRASIEGEQAATIVASIAPALEAGIPAGMLKLSEAMAGAARS